MATLLEMTRNVRMLCADPKAQRPPFERVLRAVLVECQNIYNTLSNTGKAWAVGETDIQAVANEESYLLPVGPEFGKPIVVYTVDTGNDAHIERAIEPFEIGNIDYNWTWPQSIAAAILNWDGSPHSAQRIAFYREGSEVYAKLKPIPASSAQYHVFYTIGDWIDSVSLEDSAVLSEFHHLPETRAAQSILPSCEWWADEKENRERRKELFVSLRNDEQRFAPVFENYISNSREERLTTRWAPDFDD